MHLFILIHRKEGVLTKNRLKFPATATRHFTDSFTTETFFFNENTVKTDGIIEEITPPAGHNPYKVLSLSGIQPSYYYNYHFTSKLKKKTNVLPIVNKSDWKVAVKKSIVVDAEDNIPASSGLSGCNLPEIPSWEKRIVEILAIIRSEKIKVIKKVKPTSTNFTATKTPEIITIYVMKHMFIHEDNLI